MDGNEFSVIYHFSAGPGNMRTAILRTGKTRTILRTFYCEPPVKCELANPTEHCYKISISELWYASYYNYLLW